MYTVKPPLTDTSRQRTLPLSGHQTAVLTISLQNCTLLQSIYVTRDRVILKFEARVQIYVAVLNICCEVQNSGRNVVRFSKINSYEISFWLVLFKIVRSIRFLGVWWHYFAVNSRISETFSEKSSTFRWNVEYYKEESGCSFQFRNLRSRVT